ncbi:hypothetical protein BDV40DRAFT_288087 [Aspergillus tamarii]|uniref:Uncharacterized protein n=1 Tax=Aspergillus tamarii TaxID=41984 RepID=A0A5N6UWF3_ASPTM|nr:hypothetical protein BDV40DRAFT_288087 [Aspergillus tamarii]
MAALVFLRVFPLFTTSSYLTFTITEDFYFKSYLEPSVIRVADHLLSSYITVWYNRGMVLVFTIYPLTWCTAIVTFVLYLLGFLVNIAHMLWEPQAINFLTSIKKQGSSGSTEIFRQWYRMNLIRGALADVPAWSCFLARFLVWESVR